MNTRGLTEIVILTVGLQLGILDGELFSLMVVMALVTTVMTGPLLSLIYPRRRVERDIAEAEKAALGVHGRVPGAGRRGPAGRRRAARVAPRRGPGRRQRRPAEVVLSHLVPYPTPGRLEVGSGLSGELLEMTRVMGELDALAAPVRARGSRRRCWPDSVPTRSGSCRPRWPPPRPNWSGRRRRASGLCRRCCAATPGRLVTLDRPLPTRDGTTVLTRLDGGGSRRCRPAGRRGGSPRARGVELVVDASALGRRDGRSAVLDQLTRAGLTRCGWPRSCRRPPR